MIDLTPLDVRKKRGDFRKVFRGYDPDEVDTFLEVVAERMEVLVKENLRLEERVDRLQEQVESQEGRQEAVREALVTAQELRAEMREQARREAELLRREAESRVESVLADADRRLDERREALEELERMRLRFLKSFRTLLERELDAVEVEEGRAPLEDTALEIDFTAEELRSSLPETTPEEAPETPGPGDADDGDPAPADSAEASEEAVEIASLAPEERPAGTAGGTGDEGRPPPEASSPGEDDDESLWLSSVLKEEEEGRRGTGDDPEGPS